MSTVAAKSAFRFNPFHRRIGAFICAPASTTSQEVFGQALEYAPMLLNRIRMSEP
jgi:hypothetical protein